MSITADAIGKRLRVWRVEESGKLIQIYDFPIPKRSVFMCLLVPVSLSSWEAAYRGWLWSHWCIAGTSGMCGSRSMRISFEWNSQCLDLGYELDDASFFFFSLKNWPCLYISLAIIHFWKRKHFEGKADGQGKHVPRADSTHKGGIDSRADRGHNRNLYVPSASLFRLLIMASQT